MDDTEQQIDNFQIQLSLQYGLDVVEEDSPAGSIVFLNIAPMTIQEKIRRKRRDRESANKSSLITLMSHFRILRNTIDSYEEVNIFQFQKISRFHLIFLQANLEDIDALLGCPICLPVDAVVDNFNTMVQSHKDIVCRCYFYCINWFIEVINTFTRSKPFRAKVIQRLRNVIELKGKFYRALAKNTSFMPPQSVFMGEPARALKEKGKAGPKKKTAAGKKGKGKGTKKANTTNNDTTMTTPNKVFFFLQKLLI